MYSDIGAAVKALDGVVLGFSNDENYLKPENPFFGATIGPVANRLYNPQGITLHGGANSWAFKTWSRSENGNVTTFDLVDGDVRAQAKYTLVKTKTTTTLEIEFWANSSGTSIPLSMANHCYFSLDGESTIDDSDLWLCSDKVIEHGNDSQNEAPTGQLKTFKRASNALTASIDHTFVIDEQRLLNDAKLDTREDPLVKVAVLSKGNVSVTVETTEPVFQVYTGDYNNVPRFENENRSFGARSGVAIEAARPTNAWYVPQWKKWTDMAQGDYGSRTVYTVKRG